MNFPLQQDVRRRPKTPLIKFKKEREGANNECKAKLPSEGGGGIFFLCFFLCSHPVFNVMRIYSKPCKMNDSSFFEFESVYLCI